MQIVKQTSQQLTLRHYPRSSWMVSILCMLTGSLSLLSLFVGGTQTLSCDRTTQRCELEHSTVLSTTSNSFALSSLEEANVDISAHADGETYQVVLRTSEGTLLLTRYSQPDQGQSRIANQHAQAINAFINNPNQASLFMRQSDHWFGLLIGGYFILAGGSIAARFGTIVTWNFDRQTQQFTIKHQGLLGTQTTQHPLHLVQSCRVAHWVSSDGDTYRTSLMLRSGGLIPITPTYPSDYKSNVITQKTIQSFLQLSTDPAYDSAASSSPSTALSRPQSSPATHGHNNSGQAGENSSVDGNNVFEALVLDPVVFKDMSVGGAEKRDAAIADYRRQIVRQPENTALYFHLAFILKMQQQNQEAARVLETAHKRFLQDGQYAKAHQVAQAMQTLGLTSKTSRQ